MTATLRPIFADQLSRGLVSLCDLDRDRDVVLMMEVRGEATHVPHHRKKIAFLFSAMRHFAATLSREGITLRYVRLDDPENSHSFAGEIARAVETLRPQRIIATQPGEWRVLADMRQWKTQAGLPVEILPDDRFLCSAQRFARWAEGRKQLRLEFFYREMRRETGLLMRRDGTPEGGQWNFDQDNRKAPPPGLIPPPPLSVEPDALTREVIELVARSFPEGFGDLDPFPYAVTPQDAQLVFEHFVTERLACFGDYQDAMLRGQDWLYHGVIALYLNCGLLDPLSVCRRAERAWSEGQAPLNAVEGFIRQILGWREYVRGLYWLEMPGYAATNALDAQRPLPEFYWTGRTDMACIAAVVDQTRRLAYAHHIQRLMVTGQFALLAGIAPREIEAWYLAVYADAFDWVELPNTHGMAIFADGGRMASKPYAASGAYIDRMSDYCGTCRYDVKKKLGPRACPFNYLYWDFLMRHRARLEGNPRLSMPYRNLARFEPERREAIHQDATRFLRAMERGERI